MYAEQKCCELKSHESSQSVNVSENVGAPPLPVGSLHVALPLGAHHPGSLLDDAVACLKAEVEASVSVVGAFVEHQRGVLLRAGGGSGEGQEAGEDGLTGRTGMLSSALAFNKR